MLIHDDVKVVLEGPADGYPLEIMDSMWEEPHKPARWAFVGAFPLAEIAKGRRACRLCWRVGEPHFAFMLAVVACTGSEGSELMMQRETAADNDPSAHFSNIEDMLADDWYLEIEDESELADDVPSEETAWTSVTPIPG